MISYGLFHVFQSTLSVRRATDDYGRTYLALPISIHALRKESDSATADDFTRTKFQSTLSVRRATGQANTNAMTDLFQSTLSVRRATYYDYFGLPNILISIHALRKESDRAAGHFCPLSETQASCLALSISNNTTGTTNNMPKTSSDNVRIPAHFRFCSSLRC